MTHKQATVWRYIQGINLKESSQPWIIKLPEAINDASGPLPFGLVVPTSAEPAFLIVTAAGGRITYWESLSSAANIDLNRQKQQGTQGAVSGMVTGEVITKVTEAEPHGFLLTFSTGRIAHMTVSDPQGKPLINVHYLRSGVARPGGLFGSLRNALSTAAWRRNVAAIKAGSSSQRGQRYAVVATTKGAFQVWDLNWNGAHSLVSEIDANEDLLKALKEGGNILEEKHHRFQVLDFTFLPRGRRGKELAKPTEQGDCNLLVLTIVSDLESSIYTLVGLNLSKGFVSIDVVHPISCYTSPYQAREDFKPQVLVPEPAQTAFVIFETSVVLVSLIELEDSPTSQLQMEAHTLPDPFQDVIDFRKDKDYRVVGCAAEPLDRTQSCSSCILLVDGFGAVRVAAQPVDEGQSVLDRATVTARTKLEQAVFYGNLPQDLLDFSGRPEIVFTDKEVAEAALEVSTSIMQSTSTYIPALSPSMEQQIHRRSVALADLMKHLVRHYQPLDRLTRWKLLWNAEKMAAAGAVWRAWNVTIAAKREHEKNLLVEIIDFLHEKFKTENDPERYETDAVRHWFVHDIGTLENILAWAPHAIEELERESREDKVKIDSFTKARYLSEANDIILSALETAFRFREANATLYGVGHELMVDGVLESGYEDLPEIWTAEPRLVTQVEILINSSRQTAIEYNGAEEEPIMKLIDKLMTNNPRLVEIWCHIYTERFRWLISSEDENIQIEGDKLRKSFFEVRKEMLMKLSDIGLGQQGIKLAAKYQDMNALVEIIDRGVKETTLHLQDKGAHDSEKDHYRDILLLLKNQVRTYFRQFHHQWAAAYFAKHISSGKTTEVFQEAANYQPYLTAFLLHPLYAKIGWINQVHAEHNYSAAADSLKVAQQREMRLWNKKIQLGMCKLAVLAAKTKKQEPDEDVNSYLCGIDQAMTVVRMQENLYNYIRPTVQIAMDLAAELDLVLEQYCKRYVKGKPALHKVLTRNLTQLVARDKLGTEDLIDTLTLIDEGKLHPHDEDFADKRFFCALNLLKVCKFMDGAVARTDLHEKIIWRRCMIQDDWEAINRTELKDDTQVEVETGATALFKTLKEGYKTGMLIVDFVRLLP